MGPVLSHKRTIWQKRHFFGHVRKGVWKGALSREMFGVRGKPLAPWANEIVKLVRGCLADAAHQVVD